MSSGSTENAILDSFFVNISRNIHDVFAIFCVPLEGVILYRHTKFDPDPIPDSDAMTNLSIFLASF